MNGKSPLVSVIMPVYNAQDYVGYAIESILSQTYTNFELIIVDDASSDDSLKMINSYCDERIQVLKREENAGYPTAMNQGLSMSKGIFVARMDADDISAANRIENQVAFLNSHPELVFVGTRKFWVTPRGKFYFPESLANPEEDWITETWERVLKRKRAFTDPSVIVLRKYIENVGGYRTYLPTGQDVDLWLRLLENGKQAATINARLYGRRMLLNAISYSKDTSKNNRIPRALAEERQKMGSDAVMRGESIDCFSITREMEVELHVQRIEALWRAARRIAIAKDYVSSVLFTLNALQAGGINENSVRWLVRYLRVVLFKSNRIS